ncbi:hypothetical protein C8R44DRAFT_781474 [Mycena epipterygia]|nr:hypothetical protein C8R44DRAFT_781474 [Mycena epipterygia]
MSLTLPVEAMARLQVSFKVLLPDGRFSFDMASNPTPCSTRVSGMKLHFQGTHDETGGVTFTVWASESGHPETNSTDDDCSSLDDSDISYEQHSNNDSLNFELDPLSVQAPAIPPSIFPSLGDSPSMVDVYADNIGLDSETSSIVGSVNNSQEPFMTTICSSRDGAAPSSRVNTARTVCRNIQILHAPSPSESLQHDSPSSSFDRSRPYKCLQADCSLWFKREYTRRVHMSVHLPSTAKAKDRKFSCTFDGCSMLFSRKHDRLRHEVANHGISTQWNCNPCNKYFSSQNTLERHLLDKHSDSPGC